MFQRILVVFDNEKCCPEALIYASELALRMDSEVTFLMLIKMSFLDLPRLQTKRNTLNRIEKKLAKKLGAMVDSFSEKGISTCLIFRAGKPAEELLKFLAEKQPFNAMIWGSSENLPDNGIFPKGHWMNKIVENLECPVLTVGGRVNMDKKKTSREK